MAIHGLIFAANYAWPGSQNRLAGCLADAASWAGRKPPLAEIATPGEACLSLGLLLEEKATKANVVDALKAIAAKCPKGGSDHFFIQYSGHGTQVPNRDGTEADGYDEAICCYDFQRGGLLFDNELCSLLSGAQGLIVTDCCHSQTMLRAMPLVVDSPIELPTKRAVPFADVIEGWAPCQVTQVIELARAHRAIAREIRDESGAIPGIVHLSGCRDEEVSYDATINGHPTGALTYFALEAYRQLPAGATYQQWIDLIQKKLPDSMRRYVQHPQMTATADDLRRVLPGKELAVSPALPAQGEAVRYVLGGKTFEVREVK